MKKAPEFVKKFNVEDVSLSIQRLTSRQLREIESAANEVSMIRVGGDTQMVLKLDPYKKSLLIANACVVALTGFQDDLGRNVPFTKGDVSEFIDYEFEIDGETVDFLSLVSKYHDEVQKEFEENKKVAEKN